MNRTQIAEIYDSFPESQQNMPKEQFIREVTATLDPNRMAAEADAIVQRRHMGRMQKTQIDRAMRGGPA